MHAQVTDLDGGALLSADLDGAPVLAGASVLPPEGDDAVPIALAPSLDGGRLVQ